MVKSKCEHIFIVCTYTHASTENYGKKNNNKIIGDIFFLFDCFPTSNNDYLHNKKFFGSSFIANFKYLKNKC